MIERAHALVNLSAIRQNYSVIQSYVGHDTKILAMVKADAYGHGLSEVAATLADADFLGVAALQEAILLRESGCSTNIVVMNGFSSLEELTLFFKFNLQAVVHHPSQIKLLASIATSDQISVWLKLDTGMHRLGLPGPAFITAYDQLMSLPCVKKPLTLMTHLANADDTSWSAFTAEQIQHFHSYTDRMLGQRSICNSAGLIDYLPAALDIVRPGILLYGVSPQKAHNTLPGIQSAMTFSSAVIATKSVPKGGYIGYGSTYQCQQDIDIAVVAVGYGDGYPRHAAPGTPVLIRGERCPLVGRVSMDMLTVDISHLDHCQVGDRVTLWGADLPVTDVARSADTIPYELFCQLTSRVSYHYSR